jgi:Tetracyclin repressor-like, C-terminal domain
LFDAFRERVFQPRRAEGCQLVREAMAAGELPATLDPDFIISMLIGPQILRALLGQDVGPGIAQMLFEFVIGGCLPGERAAARKPLRPR